MVRNTSILVVRPDHPEMGACWPFVVERINFFTYGFYPIDQRWRVDGFFTLLAIGVVWMAWLNAPYRKLGCLRRIKDEANPVRAAHIALVGPKRRR